jgi:acyl carrier protein
MNKDEIEVLVVESLSKFLKRSFDPEELKEPYDRLGADSMDMVVLAFELEKAIGKKISPEFFMQHDSIQDALDAL